jgi:cytoskeletal protein CcmA (bactofilin family)
MPGKTEVDMFKSKAPEKDQSMAANLEEVVGRAVQQQHSVVEHPLGREPMTKSGTSSCIGSGMSIVGNIECNGPAQVFGRIKGELRASDLLIGDGAQIEGSVIAQDVTVCGRVKGTIRAVRVKLQDGGAVEGDIFHRSLAIDENSLFEGSSRRVENPPDIPSADAKGSQEEDMQNSALAPYLQRVAT